MQIMEPDQIYVKILLELEKESLLRRASIANIVAPNFPYVSNVNRRSALEEADRHARILERNGMVRKASYRRNDYTLQITQEGREDALKLKKTKGPKNESG